MRTDCNPFSFKTAISIKSDQRRNQRFNALMHKSIYLICAKIPLKQCKIQTIFAALILFKQRFYTMSTVSIQCKYEKLNLQKFLLFLSFIRNFKCATNSNITIDADALARVSIYKTNV